MKITVLRRLSFPTEVTCHKSVSSDMNTILDSTIPTIICLNIPVIDFADRI